MKNKILVSIFAFCSIFVIVGACTVFSTGLKMIKGYQTRQWPRTAATVVKAECTKSWDSESTTFLVQTIYTYTVEGQSYEGRTIHPAYMRSSDGMQHYKLEQFLQSHPKVWAYYNPSNPSDCTLATGFYFVGMSSFCIGITFTCAGIGFALTFYFVMMGEKNLLNSIRPVNVKTENRDSVGYRKNDI